MWIGVATLMNSKPSYFLFRSSHGVSSPLVLTPLILCISYSLIALVILGLRLSLALRTYKLVDSRKVLVATNQRPTHPDPCRRRLGWSLG